MVYFAACMNLFSVFDFKECDALVAALEKALPGALVLDVHPKEIDIKLLGAREIVSGAEPEWDLVPQMQVSLSDRQHVLINVGTRVPLTGRSSRGSNVMVYLLWDWFDGTIFDGW